MWSGGFPESRKGKLHCQSDYLCGFAESKRTKEDDVALPRAVNHLAALDDASLFKVAMPNIASRMMLMLWRGFRLVTVAAVTLVWLAGMNHCVFASFVPRALESEQSRMPSDCPMHAKHQPGKPQKPDGCSDLPCCNNLQATPIAPTKLLADPSWTGLRVAFFTSSLNVDDSDAVRVALFSDTGPPGQSSFAELVLQRSILAHAPPLSLS